MNYDCVFWDWNGTLLDDCQAAMESVNDMLIKKKLPLIDLEKYYTLIDTPIINFYIKLFGTEDIDFPAISRDFHDSYERRLPDIELSSGAREMLERFRLAGLKQVIISASHTQEVEELTASYGIDGYFDAILGASDNFATSKVDRALEYFNVSGLCGKRVLSVGDTLHDLETAQALGADCILLSSGHCGERILKSEGSAAIAIINSLPELTQFMGFDN